MAMTYCSHCGIQNRDGSKFCNNCGARLVAEQGLRCPMCSTLNETENVFCSSCGARLVPLVATPPAGPKAPPAPPIKGLSLPARPLPGETETPKTDTQAQPTPQPQARTERSIEPEPEELDLPEPSTESSETADSPQATEGEIPDWIARLRSLPQTEPVEDDGIVVEEIPDWLKSPLDQQTPVVSAPEPEPAEPIAPIRKIEVPNWLHQAENPAVESKTFEPIKSEDELPDWLKQTAENFSPASITPSIKDDELPDWLRPEPSATTEEPTAAVESKTIEESPQQPAVSEQPIVLETTGIETSSDVDEIPDWLRNVVAVEPQESTETASTPTAKTQVETPFPGEMPPWIAALKPKDADAIAPAFSGEKSEEPIQAGEIPPWLSAMKPKEAEAVQPAKPAQPQAQESVESDLPDWVMALKPKDADQAIVPTPPTQEEPAVGELPAWVAALKPKEISETPQALDLGSPTQGPAILSDLPGVLPLAAALAQPHAKPQRVVPAERREGALVFESLLASTAEPGMAETPAKPVRKRTIKPLIYVLILLAVLVPFIVPMDAVVPITQVPTENFYDLVNALPPNALVIVSFDYDPGTAGEMDLLAKAVVRHLVQRGAKILAVSTIDTGPQMAQHIMSAIAQENGKTKYGTDYAIVYLPGQPGLKQVATSNFPTKDYNGKGIDAFLASANFTALNNAALIIEITGRDDQLKMWIEQVQPRANVKMAAAVSAAVEPKARAYRGSNQLAALTSGMLGAAQYEALTRQSGQALIAVNSQSIAQIVLILIIVLGNGMQLIARARGQTT